MAHVKKTIIIDLDRPRVLRLSIFAQMKFEVAAGKPVTEMSESATDMACFLWAAMLEDAEEHSEEITVDQVAKLVDTGNIIAVSEAISKLSEGLEESPLAPSGETGGGVSTPLPESIGD